MPLCFIQNGSEGCLHVTCLPCGLDVESEDSSLGLANFLQQHTLTDQHNDGETRFRSKKTAELNRFLFSCESCSTSFVNHADLRPHKNCQGARHR